MRSFLRSWVLLFLSVAVVAGAVIVFRGQAAPNRPTPLPVRTGEAEIAWLYPATNAATWERFVAAVRRASDRLRETDAGIDLDDSLAFPEHTTATPEIALIWPKEKRRLVFRWYKLTSDWKTRDWVESLLRRQPPPLAVIGGNTSDSAREQGRQLSIAAQELPESVRPLFLLTTATADRVPEMQADSPGADPAAVPQSNLIDLYPGRTFRFCFTNEMMADAVTQFIWREEDLRPDSDPVHEVRWLDDPYSNDLRDGFQDALRRLATREAANDWLWASGAAVSQGLEGVTAGGLPFWRAGPRGSGFRMALFPTPQQIDSSVGTYLTPNRFEEKVAENLLELAMARPQRRPLLIVTGQTLPTRRFLRAIARLAPDYARRFVVATGDAVAFNTVYRDRQVAWPIQDLPFPFVFFSHYNPVDPSAGFHYRRDLLDATEVGISSTGTEDVLLNSDIVEALALAVCRNGSFEPNPDHLKAGLLELRLLGNRLGFDPAGRRVFGPDGNRRSGTGEHVVCLRPHIISGRVLPLATIDVWERRTERTVGPVWERRGEPLTVSYDNASLEVGANP